MKAVDFSQYGGLITDAVLDCWIGQGIELAIVQCNSINMKPNLELLHRRNFPTAIYVYEYWHLDWYSRTGNFIWQARQSNPNILFCAIDVEETGSFLVEKIWDAIRACEDENIPYCIYTADWCWPDNTDFSHLPLWVAQSKNQEPSADFPSGFFEFAGWRTPAIWQWKLDTTLCGHSVDLNVVYDKFWEGEEVPGPWLLNADGSQRIESDGHQIVIINGGVDVLRVGNKDGTLPGQLSKRFGEEWLWLVTEAEAPIDARWSKVEGD